MLTSDSLAASINSSDGQKQRSKAKACDWIRLKITETILAIRPTGGGCASALPLSLVHSRWINRSFSTKWAFVLGPSANKATFEEGGQELAQLQRDIDLGWTNGQ
ncbi:hypothetical protein Ddc_22625 [Ditylenchus destructor]|nr:hypothetical protein Ddc_22625 [Ditylenchus destructor]